MSDEGGKGAALFFQERKVCVISRKISLLDTE